MVNNMPKKNEGKIFEESFVKSLPNYCWHKRLNDNASSWSGGCNTRFTSTNECDFLLFDCQSRTLTALELKTTKNSLTYWREDFEKDGVKGNYQIKKNQILGLQRWSSYLMNCGFIFNFREKDNRTFFVEIENFLEYTTTLSKKSINIQDVLEMDPIEIESKLLKVKYRYNLEDFLFKIKIAN